MKRRIFIMLLLISCQVAKGQSGDNKCCLAAKNLVGTWQRDRKIVGNGLGQNFVFRENGTFLLNVGNDADDVVGIIKLNGRYRLDADKLYFTILSKTTVEGELEVGSMGSSASIFQFGRKSTVKEIKEQHPKEIADPCYITIISSRHIKINNEVYYKVQ